MKVHYLRPYTSFIDNDRIDAFHHLMFHGIVKRELDPDVGEEPYKSSDKLRFPSKLIVNVSRINHIIQPRVNLFVSQVVANRLAGIATINLLKADIVKMYEFPYAEGDFSYRYLVSEIDSLEAEERFVQNQPDARVEAGSLPTYFELICPTDLQLKKEFDNVIDYTVMPADIYGDAWTHYLCGEMFIAHPIVQGAGHFFREDVFANISNYINFEFFWSKELVLN